MSVAGTFPLFSVSHLEAPAGAVAASLDALHEGIAAASPEVLFHHVTRLPLRFANSRDLPANDFARWARTALQDPEAAERLAFAGVPSSEPLEEVRASLLAALANVPVRRRRAEAPEEAAFRFVRVRSVMAPLSIELAEPRDIAAQWLLIDRAALFYHLIEAPTLGPDSARLVVWLRARGSNALAQAAEDLVAAGHPMSRLHRDLGRRWRRRLIPERLVERLDSSEEQRKAEAHDAIARLASRLRSVPEGRSDGTDPEPSESQGGPLP